MDEKELEAVALKTADIVGKALAAQAEATKVEADRIAAIEKAAAEKAVEEYKATQEPAWKGGFATKKVTKLGMKDDEMQSFLHYVRTGDPVAYKAAMVEGTDCLGGYLVPNDFYATIQAKINEISWPRRAGVQVLTGSRDIMNVPIEATSFTKFTKTAEACDYAEEEPTIGNVAITAHKWTKLLKLSEELVEDQAANLDEFLSNSLADWASQTESYYCAVGSGTNQHQGVAGGFDSTTVGSVAHAGTSDVITVAEVFALAYSLNDGLRDRGVFLMDSATESYLRQLLVTTPYAFGPPSIQGTGTAMGNIFGRPVFNNSGLVSYTGSTDCEAVIIAFFDPKAYTIYERKGLAVRRLNELYAANGQVGIIASFRQGGAITTPAHISWFCVKQGS